MPDFRDRLGDPNLIHFYDYWVSLRGDRAMPSRKDVDPLHIPPEFLPNLMLIDVLHVREVPRGDIGELRASAPSA